jgi:hypothetical protein
LERRGERLLTTTALGKALPRCKPAVCPNDGTGTCDVKRAVEARGGGLSACLVSLGHHEVMQAYLAAIQTGDLAGPSVSPAPPPLASRGAVAIY